MEKTQFNPATNYDKFYENHKFEPFNEDHVLNCHLILPRAAWALDVAQDNDYKTFLDLCCLDGFVGLTLAQQNGMDGEGVDLSEPGVKIATERAERYKLPMAFHKEAVEEYLEREVKQGTLKFDMIMLYEAVEHFKDTPKVLEMCKKLLTDKGSILISTPDAEHYYGIGNDDACHLRYYSHRTEKDWGDLTREWEGRPILSLSDEIEKLGLKVAENNVFNELIHLHATK